MRRLSRSLPAVCPSGVIHRARMVLVAGLWLVAGVAAAADELVAAPPNPEFAEQARASLAAAAPYAANAAADDRTSILIPSPLDRRHMTGLQSPTVRGSGTTLKAAAVLPASFDLRAQGKVTPVKNQGACGDCWSFATIASVESNILVAGGATSDFSENHQNVRHGFLIPACQGGNADMAAAYQTRWGNGDGFAAGLVNEADDPYTSTTATSAAGLSPRVHLQEHLVLPPRASGIDNANWKFAIKSYGAVNVSYYVDGGMASGVSSAYWNQAAKAFYYNGTAAPNHAVALVGWDDNYAATNFVQRPPGNGAYLVKNSWGAAWGNAGYFWISYHDTRLGDAHVFRKPEAANNYLRAYLYDPLGHIASIGYGATVAHGANVFTAAAGETLRAVAFNTPTVASGYAISIYTGVTSTPASGVLEGGAVNTSGTADFAGYHTVQLTRPVQLAAGQKFAVVVRFTTPAYNYPLPVEYPYPGYANTTSAPGQSYVSANGSSWTDLAAALPGANLNIRAYTGPAGTTTALASSLNPSVAGQPVTLVAVVTSPAGNPGGSVAFADGGVKLCAAAPLALVGGRMQASCTTGALVAGAHAITATYGGAGTFPASSATLAQTVNAAAAPSTTTVASSSNPSTTGQAVTFTAVVAAAAGLPTGTVVFKDGAATLCAASLVAVNGKAQGSCATSTLAAGAHTVVASYGGSAAFAASTGSLAQTVAPPRLATTTKLTSSLNPSVGGQAVTFTAVVTATSGSPAGTVTFTDGATTLCAAVKLALVGTTMQAKCSTTALAVGARTVTGTFAGSTSHAPSSAGIAQTVSAPKVAAAAALASSLSPAVVGRAVTLTATVSGGAGAATGAVTIKEGTKVICTATLAAAGSSARATCTTSAFTVGSHRLVATYAGDTRYLAATSATFTQVVTAK